LAVPAREQLAARSASAGDGAELVHFPSGWFLEEMSLGHRHLLADVAWLTAIQYYGKHRQSDRRYAMAPHLFDIITDADPAFESAYLFGALIMAESGCLEEGARVLRRGAERNPLSWYLRFELGFYHYICTRSFAEAAAAFAAAAKVPGAPGHPARFAAAAYEKAGDPETARQLWQLIGEESDNPEIKRMAEERLAALETG
jgi:hypothetical protein